MTLSNFWFVISFYAEHRASTNLKLNCPLGFPPVILVLTSSLYLWDEPCLPSLTFLINNRLNCYFNPKDHQPYQNGARQLLLICSKHHIGFLRQQNQHLEVFPAISTQTLPSYFHLSDVITFVFHGESLICEPILVVMIKRCLISILWLLSQYWWIIKVFKFLF